MENFFAVEMVNGNIYCISVLFVLYHIYMLYYIITILSRISFYVYLYNGIRLSEKFLSFYKEIIDVQHFPFYIILLNYIWSILFYQNKNHNVRRIRFRVCIKMHRCKRRVCKRHFSDNLIYATSIISSTSSNFKRFG